MTTCAGGRKRTSYALAAALLSLAAFYGGTFHVAKEDWRRTYAQFYAEGNQRFSPTVMCEARDDGGILTESCLRLTPRWMVPGSGPADTRVERTLAHDAFFPAYSPTGDMIAYAMGEGERTISETAGADVRSRVRIYRRADGRILEPAQLPRGASHPEWVGEGMLRVYDAHGRAATLDVENGELSGWTQYEGIHANARLPRFSLPDLDGKMVPSPERGLALIVSSATWCPPCWDMMPHLSDLSREYPEVAFYIVTDDERGDEDAQLGLFRLRDAANVSVAVDRGGEVFRSYMSPEGGVPFTVIVDSGRVRYMARGARVYEEGKVASQLERLAATQSRNEPRSLHGR
jgi:thiol-disulfide isomerase/thioredoxin